LELSIQWLRQLKLSEVNTGGQTYSVSYDKLPSEPGIYIFGRHWGKNFEALYVGKANKLSKRVRGQLNNHRLMLHLKNANTGKRVLLAGLVRTKQAQNMQKCLKLIERGLIRHYLSENHDIVNKAGTRIRRHKILSAGRVPRRFIPREISVERQKGD